jgi:L-lactate dehydrogenase
MSAVQGRAAVGAACALASIMRGATREIVLLNRTRKRAEAVAIDMRYGTPLSPLTEIRAGDYKDWPARL